MLSNKRTSLIEIAKLKLFKRFRGQKAKGSIVLEAALVMPVFVIVLFWFIYMVHMTLLTVQLHFVASNAVKQVSAHLYPVAISITGQSPCAEQNAGSGSSDPFNWTMPSLSLSEWAEQYASSLPQPISSWVIKAARKGEEPLQDVKNSMVESALDPVVKPLLKPFLKGTLLNEDQLHINRVTVPDLRTGSNPYFGVEISYKLPMKIPFTTKHIVLQTRAEERVWIGDTGELKTRGQGSSSSGQSVVILSKPDPAYAGHRATVKARVAAGSTAKLTVYYKSGVSQAKYLGEAVAGGDGTVAWNWLVGGNTTPGTWTFVIETGDGSQTTAEFNVTSPSDRK